VIAMAGELADRVMFTLGAVPERIRWGMDVARQARADAGLDPEGVRFGAYVNLVSHPDRATARALVRGGLTTFARFSVMHGDLAGPTSEADRAVLLSLHDGYDMKSHTRADSQQAGLMSDAFIDRFAIAGPPEHCVERLRELEALGLDKIAVSGPTAGADRNEARRALELLDDIVVPEWASG
jgi:5,10-methylenetetrahydromethanopterin reductase